MYATIHNTQKKDDLHQAQNHLLITYI